MTLLDDLRALKARAANVSSSDIRRVAERAGYTYSRTKGSHHSYTKSGVRALVIPEKATSGTVRGILIRLIREQEAEVKDGQY